MTPGARIAVGILCAIAIFTVLILAAHIDRKTREKDRERLGIGGRGMKR